MAKRPRLFCETLSPGRVVLRGAEAHHARDVLRLRPGEAVELFDGRGRSGPATAETVRRDEVSLLCESINYNNVPEVIVTLSVAVPKQAVQQELVARCTELGVTAFQPIVCAHSAVGRIKVERWVRWAMEACKQCGRNWLPRVSEAIGLAEALAGSPAMGLRVFGDPGASPPIPPEVSRGDWTEVTVFIGPEGGFTEDEIGLLRSAGALAMRVGEHVLRIETAAAAVTAALIGLRLAGRG